MTAMLEKTVSDAQEGVLATIAGESADDAQERSRARTPVRPAFSLPVTVYTGPGCYQCKATIHALRHANVPFTTIDVSQDDQAAKVVRGLGYSSVPVVTVGTPELTEEHAAFQAWMGHRPTLIEALARQIRNIPVSA